uniref:Ribosome biogenesis protein NOP53 n=1 Tax=Setaria digitata TaxID=48799 RepID=A0A915PYA6_9BILA
MLTRFSFSFALGAQCSLKETSTAEEYCLLGTKNKLPQAPKTIKHITSILPHVEVAPAGASYNPSISKYLDYVTEIAEEEKRKIKKENLEHQFVLPKEKCVTQEEIEMELTAGLNDESYQVLGNESEKGLNDDEEKKPVMKPRMKRKTWKTRCMQRLERKRKQNKKVSEFQKEQMHLVYSTRKLSKEISKEMRKREELAKKRKEQKLIKRFAGTQRLGRGRFQPCEKSVLLAEELSGSLRELKPQGSILMERLNSLQKRNMLSIPGKKRQGKMKNRLLFKEREDRKHQEVKLGTRLI